jgi:hypothetical protein
LCDLLILSNIAFAYPNIKVIAKKIRTIIKILLLSKNQYFFEEENANLEGEET